MAKKNVRNMKVCGQSGYKYETVPAITLKGKWLEELGFHLGDYVQVKYENGQLIITPDVNKAQEQEAKTAFMDGIIIGKSDHLGNLKLEFFTEFVKKLLSSKRISTVSIGNEFEVFWQFFQIAKCHTHSKDARSNTAVVGYLIADNGTFGNIHDEPDISFDTTDFDVGFVSGKCVSRLIVVVIDKWLDTQ